MKTRPRAIALWMIAMDLILSGCSPLASFGPTIPPTLEVENRIPIIKSVNQRREPSNDGLVIFQDISFIDKDGDVNRVDYELVSATASDLQAEGATVDISSAVQRAGAVITGAWGCGNENYEVTLRVTLSDKAGNRSSPVEYTMTCGAGN